MNSNKGLIAIAIAIVLAALIVVGYDIYKESRPVCTSGSGEGFIGVVVCQ